MCSKRLPNHLIKKSFRTYNTVRDLDLLSIGLVLDIWTGKGNDGVKYARVATQEDFDKL